MTKVDKDELDNTVQPVDSNGLTASANLATAGAAVGANIGPIPAIADAAIEGTTGWLAGMTLQDGLKPESELKFWQENFTSRYYFSEERNWKDFELAYLVGIYFYEFGKDYEELRASIQARWLEVKGDSRLSWDEASDAARDAWKRLSLGKI